MTKTKTIGCGACNVESFSPTKKRWNPEMKTIALKLTFEDALKLHLALDECVHRLNRYNRATSGGRRKRVKLLYHIDNARLVVTEGVKSEQTE